MSSCGFCCLKIWSIHTRQLKIMNEPKTLPHPTPSHPNPSIRAHIQHAPCVWQCDTVYSVHTLHKSIKFINLFSKNDYHVWCFLRYYRYFLRYHAKANRRTERATSITKSKLNWVMWAVSCYSEWVRVWVCNVHSPFRCGTLVWFGSDGLRSLEWVNKSMAKQ